MADGYGIQLITHTAAADPGPFQHHAPKSAGVKAVKLTDQNVNAVAGHILKALGGPVEVKTSPVRCIYIGYVYLARVGEWVIEGWDYSDDRPTFDLATFEERQKHDLR
jgi:hypothetical protein